MKPALPLLAALLLSTPVSAGEIFRCIDKLSGAAIYQNRPCVGATQKKDEGFNDADAKPLQTFSPPAAASPAPAKPKPSVKAEGEATQVKLTRNGNSFWLMVTINDQVRLPFVFDTGATHVVLNKEAYQKLKQSGTLRLKDRQGKKDARVADGSKMEVERLRLDTITLGEVTIKNVEAMASTTSTAPCLLGISALNQFKNWQMDGQSGTLILR